MGVWFIALGIISGIADSYPKFVRRATGYERIPHGSLRNPCDGKLPVRDQKVLLFDASRTDFHVVGKALEGNFYLWREYSCKDDKVHGTAKEYRGGKVTETVPYVKGRVHGKKYVYHPDGKVKEVLHFKSGKREGEYRKFDGNGQLLVVARYDDNKLDGEVKYFDHLRGVTTVFKYDDGKAKGEPRYETSNVQEALILAARNGHGDQVEKFLSEGVGGKKAAPDSYGETEATEDTALIAALHAGHAGVVRRLLAKGANPGTPNRSGRLSPLMVAVNARQKVLMKELLDKGADVNWQDGDGNTALHLAVNQGEVELAQLLVAAGASTTVRNKAGATPSFLGASKGSAMEAALKGEAVPAPSEDSQGEG